MPRSGHALVIRSGEARAGPVRAMLGAMHPAQVPPTKGLTMLPKRQTRPFQRRGAEYSGPLLDPERRTTANHRTGDRHA